MQTFARAAATTTTTVETTTTATTKAAGCCWLRQTSWPRHDRDRTLADLTVPGKVCDAAEEVAVGGGGGGGGVAVGV